METESENEKNDAAVNWTEDWCPFRNHRCNSHHRRLENEKKEDWFRHNLYHTQCDNFEHFNAQDKHLAKSKAEISRIECENYDSRG